MKYLFLLNFLLLTSSFQAESKTSAEATKQKNIENHVKVSSIKANTKIELKKNKKLLIKSSRKIASKKALSLEKSFQINSSYYFRNW